MTREPGAVVGKRNRKLDEGIELLNKPVMPEALLRRVREVLDA